MSSSESVSDLKREIARHKDAEQRNAHYIGELEARLTKADESVLSLRETIEKLEHDCDSRREEVEILQERLNNVLTDGEAWRTDLEGRESRVRELEAKMEQWEAKRAAADEERSRLKDINTEVQRQRRSLEVEMTDQSPSPAAEPNGEPSVESESLQQQFDALRETQAATLADLDSLTAKYRDALKEISDLAEQIKEMQLGSPSSDRSESPDGFPDVPATPRRRHKMRSRENSDVQIAINNRRPFFRHAASVESLHAR